VASKWALESASRSALALESVLESEEVYYSEWELV
jgi:hypothetical protein